MGGVLYDELERCIMCVGFCIMSGGLLYCVVCFYNEWGGGVYNVLGGGGVV